jgi:hypothetical protein
MKKLIVNDTVATKFREIEKSCEVYDDRGNLLGYFAPWVDPSAYEGVDAPIRDAESASGEAPGRGRRLAEILADLERPA